MAQYYLVEQWTHSGWVAALTTLQVEGQPQFVVAQGNRLSFYSLGAKPTRVNSHQLNCRISSLVALPSRHHTSDYLLVADSDGRWGVWGMRGFEHVDNTRMAPTNALYQRQHSTLHTHTMASQHCHFDVNDTVGHFLVSGPPQITVASYQITRKGLALDKPLRFQMPFPLVRQVGWMPRGKWVGAIAQQEENTEWVVYDLGQECLMGEGTLKYRRRLVDLRQFVCSGELVGLLAGSEVMVVRLGGWQVVARWEVCAGPRLLLDWQGGFLAMGSEMGVWKEGLCRVYGALEMQGKELFQKDTVTELVAIGEEGLGVATASGRLYLLRVWEQGWQLWSKQQYLSSLFSLHPTSTASTILCVMDDGSDGGVVSSIERGEEGGEWLQLPLELEMLGGMMELGDNCVVCVGGDRSWLLKWSQGEFKVLQSWHQQIIAANQHLIICSRAIYVWECYPLSSRQLKQEQILLGCVDGKTGYYLTAEGVVSAVSEEWQGVKEVCAGQRIYYMCFIDGRLVCASNNDFSTIDLYQEGNHMQIQLQEKTMVRSISGISLNIEGEDTNCLVVGHLNGKVYIYHSNNTVIASFTHLPPHPANLVLISPSSLLLHSGNAQYLLCSKPAPTLIPLSLSTRPLTAALYLSSAQSLLYQQHPFSALWLCRLPLRLLPHCPSLRHRVLYSCPQPPCLLVLSQHVVMAEGGCMRVLQWGSGREVVRHSNCLREVTGVQHIQLGILVFGVDQLERNTLYLYSDVDWEPLARHHLILKDKSLRSLRAGRGNQVVCRGEHHTTLYHLNSPSELTLETSLKTDLTGYLMAVEGEWVVEVDHHRLILLYHANNQRIVPVGRYLADREVREVLVGEGWIVFGEAGGVLGVLEFNLSHPAPLLRSQLRLVGQIDVGEAVTALTWRGKEVWWGTEGGTVGSISLVGEEEWLHWREEQVRMGQLQKGRVGFSYPQWRKRVVGSDKLIDGTWLQSARRVSR